jgi:hypothetical protein
MQTSIEWFIENLLGNGLLRLTKEDHNLYSKLRDKAKEMHKQEIMNAYNQGASDAYPNGSYIEGNAYYQETFKKD